jgi:tetratricopeptide (TPR) repeat protein
MTSILRHLVFLLLTLPTAALAQLPAYYDPRSLYNQATELYDKAKYGAAEEKFQQFLEQTNTSSVAENHHDLRAEARFYVAACAYNLLRNNTEALFEGFIRDYPVHTRLNEAYYYVGSIRFIRREYVPALEPLEKVETKALPDSLATNCSFMVGYCYYKAGRTQEALNRFQSIRNNKGQYAEAGNYYYSGINYEQGNYSAALDGFDRIKDPKAFGGEVPVLKATCLLKLGKYAELNEYGETLLNGPVEPTKDVFLVLGNASFEQNQYETALKHFNKYESMGGKLDRSSTYRTGFCSYRSKDIKTARERFTDVVTQQDSLTQVASYYLGHCFLKIENYENARTAFRKASELKFDKKVQEEALFQHAKVSFQTKYFEDALASLQKFRNDFPGSEYADEANGLIGEILLYTSNYREAIEYFENSSRLGSDRAQSAFQRACYLYGMELYGQRNYEKANQYFKKSFNLKVEEEQTLSSYFWYAEGLFRLKDYEKAAEYYGTYIRQPRAEKHALYTKGWFGLAWSYFKMENWDQAIRNFDKYLALSDRNVEPELYTDAILRTGDCYFMQKKYDHALKEYTTVRDFNNQGVDYALNQMGSCYNRLGEVPKAVEAYTQLVTRYRKSELRDDALLSIAKLSNDFLQDPTNASKYAGMLITDHPQSPLVPNALMERGVAEAALGNNAKAADFFKTLVYDYCFDKQSVSVAMENLSNLLSAKEYDVVEKTLREKCPEVAEAGNEKLCEISYNAAMDRFYGANYEGAIERMTDFLNSCTGSSSLHEIRFHRGESYMKLGQDDKAMEDYQILYKDLQAGEWAVKALNSAAEIRFKNKEYLTALELFTIMEQKAERKEDRTMSLFGKARSHFAAGNYEGALTELYAIQSDPNTTQWSQARAIVMEGNCKYALGKVDEAFALFDKVRGKESNAFGAESAYMMSRILYDRKDYEQSKLAVFYVRDKFPNQPYWKARASLVLAEDYVALGDTYQAVNGTLPDILKSATQYPDVMEAAQKRLAELQAQQPKLDGGGNGGNTEEGGNQ